LGGGYVDSIGLEVSQDRNKRRISDTGLTPEESDKVGLRIFKHLCLNSMLDTAGLVLGGLSHWQVLDGQLCAALMNYINVHPLHQEHKAKTKVELSQSQCAQLVGSDQFHRLLSLFHSFAAVPGAGDVGSTCVGGVKGGEV